MSMTGDGARSDQVSEERERRERNQQDIREAMEREDERILDSIRAAMAIAAHNGASFYSEKNLERLAQHDGEYKTRLNRDTTRRKSERYGRKSRGKAPRTVHQQEELPRRRQDRGVLSWRELEN
jgi:hypothetical protein